MLKLSLDKIDRSNVLVDIYWIYANAIVIAQQVKKDVNWILNNFITLLAAEPDWIDFRMPGIDNMSTVSCCPFFDFQRIKKDKNNTIFGMSIIDFIKKQIDENMVVILLVDNVY